MNLHLQFVQLGNAKKDLEHKLCALLPEIYKSGIWKKYSNDIYEYARNYGGLSNTAIKLSLKLPEKLKATPKLIEKIAEVGVYKVDLVSSLATPENEEMLAESVTMAKSAVKELAVTMRREKKVEMFGEVDEEIKISLDKEMQFLFNKIKKELGENLSNKEALRKILHKITTQKVKSVSGQKPSISSKRLVPAAQKRESLNQTNGKCIYPNCTKPHDVIHHRERYAESKSHESIVPLCKEHHEISHNGLIENELQPSENWKISLKRKLNQADELFLKYKRRLA